MNQQNQKLYVGNLNFEANEEQVRELFGNYGVVEDVKIVMDRFSGRSRGFAFVRMDNASSANKAKEALNGQPFQGKTLVIDFARQEQDRGSRPQAGGERGERRDFRSSERGEFRPRREWNSDRSERGGERRDFRSDRSDRSGNFYNR